MFFAVAFVVLMFMITYDNKKSHTGQAAEHERKMQETIQDVAKYMKMSQEQRKVLRAIAIGYTKSRADPDRHKGFIDIEGAVHQGIRQSGHQILSNLNLAEQLLKDKDFDGHELLTHSR